MLRTVEVSARLEGTREELFSMLANIERYRIWLPWIVHSSVLAREGDVAVAEIRASRWSQRTSNYELVLTPPVSIDFRQIDSVGRAGVSGRWLLNDDLGGASTLVELRLCLETPALGFGSKRRMRSELRAVLDALGSYVRQRTSARPAADPRKQKVLEIVREADGLRVWYLGESFRLPKEGDQ